MSNRSYTVQHSQEVSTRQNVQSFLHSSALSGSINKTKCPIVLTQFSTLRKYQHDKMSNRSYTVQHSQEESTRQNVQSFLHSSALSESINRTKCPIVLTQFSTLRKYQQEKISNHFDKEGNNVANVASFANTTIRNP
ncbi:hypothetical protein RRG08_034053 [Elysia crispata]|uniref:Uncharacterized protein n=1 Tax=Elysia crispata TaxID=231223 RepID=A0AAE0YL15_9GAST|nr:hypothetical protein RRG08_034053 [Elysia crispata]